MADKKASSGKVLVIGASGGVGKCVVRQLLARNYRVLGSALDQADLNNARKDDLADANWFIADLSDAEAGVAQVNEALAQSGGDTLVSVISCIGANPCGPLETTPIAVFRRTMEINTLSNLVVYQTTLPILRESKGRFIFVSSLSGKVAMPLLGYYTASKFALEGLADTMRLEAGQWGVTVSLVQPGGIATDMVHSFGKQLDTRFAELDERNQENYRDYFAQQKALAAAPNEGLLMPEEVASKIIEVLDAEIPEARYPLGGAVGLIEKRRLLSDSEIDKMWNEILPGRRSRRASA